MKNNNNHSGKNFYAFTSAALALVLMVVASVALFNHDSTAGAEAVTLTENATVVTSPFTEAVEKVRGSVVGVNNYTTYRNSYYGFGFGYGYGGGYNDDTSRQVLQGSGSGVVVADGYVLTNYHVVEDATTLEVTSGDKVYPAELKGTDEAKDIAVLYVEDLDIEPVVLGDSDQLSVGDWAICIGNPLSFTGTTTVGVISALNREITSDSTDEYGKRAVNTMIQTDAAINAGNSGGGMFNVAGELIGIPSMKYTGSMFTGSTVEGIGMAIPINEALPIIQELMQYGHVTGRAALGIQGYMINEAVAAMRRMPVGFGIEAVDPSSDLASKNVVAGDIITYINDKQVTSYDVLANELAEFKPGDTVKLTIYRSSSSGGAGRSFEVNVVLIESAGE